MKKLFTLIALLTCFIGAKAGTVVDAEINFADETDVKLVWGGFVKNGDDQVGFLDIADGCLHYTCDEVPEGANAWDTQFVLSGLGGVDVQLGCTYTIEMKIKGSAEGPWWNVAFAGQNKYGAFTVTTDWVVQELKYENVESTDNSNPLLQCGSYAGELWIEYIKISHEEKEGQKPVEWKNLEGFVNGDASQDWPEWAFKDYMEDEVNAVWRSDRAVEICAWGLVRGTNIDPSQTPDAVNDPDGNPIPEGKPRPFPCDIEEVEGDRVFVVHTTAADNQYTEWQAWDNQFFIMAPKGFKAGSQFKIHFRYKATSEASTQTQIHHENPSWYLHWQGIGDITFTPEWQEFDKVVTVDGWSSGLGYCIAFNLNVGNKEPNDFYIDDIAWQEMDLEEGIFAAAKDDSSDYNFGEAVQFEDDGSGLFTGTVGADGAWVNEVMISTVRGNDNAFQKNTIKPDDDVTIKTVDTWITYSEAGSAKIKLPAAGVWQIEVDTEEGFIRFSELDGEPLTEPEDIIVNESELVIEGVERKFQSADEAAAEGVELPEDYVADGHTWDNQFWIVANRELVGDEETIVEFDYYLISDDITEAKVTTQGHGAPGDYKGGGAGDITFTPVEDHWKGEFKVPAKNWMGQAITGVKSLAFNMAEIRQACTYVIKNIKWYLKSEALNGEGQTTENLISAEGTDNFWVVIGAGTEKYQWGHKPAEGIKGDVSGDGIVNGGDIQAVINAIVAESTDLKYDVTGDGSVNGGDIQAIINIIVASE